MSRNVLVIGGTGMLAPAVNTLAEHGVIVFAVARRPERPGWGPGVVPVRGDWGRPAELADAVRTAMDELGCPAAPQALTWIHSPYRESVHQAIGRLLTPDAVVVSLHGSVRSDPAGTAPPVPPVHAPPRRYRTLLLGFADSPGGRTRWLTDDEISHAALRSLADPSPLQVAGRVSPWSERP